MLDDSHAGANLGLSGAEGPPLDAGPALTAEEAAQELAADGRSLDEARALVRGYLADVSAQVGASADLWGLDEADLAAIRSSPPASSAAADRAEDEEARREQLASWHAADTDDDVRTLDDGVES